MQLEEEKMLQSVWKERKKKKENQWKGKWTSFFSKVSAATTLGNTHKRSASQETTVKEITILNVIANVVAAVAATEEPTA